MNTKPITREERRAAMPECTQFIDEIRKVFGEPNAIHAEENGHTVHWEKRRDENAAAA